jgi:hypothetical protein
MVQAYTLEKTKLPGRNFSIRVGRDSIPTPWRCGCRVGNPTYSPVITRTY